MRRLPAGKAASHFLFYREPPAGTGIRTARRAPIAGTAALMPEVISRTDHSP